MFVYKITINYYPINANKYSELCIEKKQNSEYSTNMISY